MEGSDASPPSSLWMIRAAELFPKPQMEKEDEQLTVSFQDLAGESVRYLGQTDDGVLALSNYRLFLLKTTTCAETSVPLGLIESAQPRDLFHLIINCKDASTVKCSFATAEQCSEWSRRISLCVGVPESLESLFAFPFYSWTSDLTATSTGTTAFQSMNNDNNEWSGRLQRAGRYEEDFRKEVERLQFDLNGTWRISYANSEFKLCPSYPGLILVPCCISDETLQNVASFRGSRRLPAVVWRHKQSGAVIARSSQPEVGWLGWRCSKDEQLLKALADACAFDRGEQNRRQNLCPSGESSPSSAEGSHEEVLMDEVRKILIVDARSYTSAVTNRARGGGCECIDYYPCAEIEFMNLGNIHAIRKSFHALRQLCACPPDVPNWLGTLERTMWLQHLSGLLAASMTVCHAIEKKGRPVLVHCSDGWDRTPQIVATAQLCLDPYYRTVEGFRILVEREWLSYGHKFADRCGHGPGSDELNERCPVFLQWLDLVHQIHCQFPCSFEFSMAYLIKLAQHSHSCLFGTFLCNTIKERIDNSVLERTFSVWPFLSGPMYRNPLYMPNREKVLWPAHNVRDLLLWSEVYLGSLGNQNPSDYPPNNVEGNQESTGQLTKTRSYGDLLTIGGSLNGFSRRLSDPNMTLETHLMMTLSDNNSITSERVGSHDLLTNIMQHTTEKLQSLTNEQSDDDVEICKINNLEIKQINDDILQSRKFLQQERNQLKMKREQEQSVKCDITNGISVKDPFRADSSRYEMIFGKQSSEDKKSVEIKRNCEHQTGKCVTNSRIELNGGEDDYKDEIDGILNRDKLDYIDMMQSVDLQAVELTSVLTTSTEPQSSWHGSVETSTDTLVPIESHHPLITPIPITHTNGGHEPTVNISDQLNENYIDGVNSTRQQSILYHTAITPITTINSFESEVHCNKAKLIDYNLVNISTSNSLNQTSSLMDESILILPEHEQLDISNNGKCNSGNNVISSSNSSNYLASTAMAPTHPHRIRRRRTSSTNSKNDSINFNKNICGSTTNSRFSTPGVRSLPLTPPGSSGIQDRPLVAISCPDGLAHALSEQNIRLQQIVYEHKLREDALQKELYGMRLALLKKTCPHCNNQAVPNDEQCSVLDNIENSSICSWEAVEDRSAPSSGANSAQPNSVLWVPDHAVSRCTGCETEFWLGRRKHHCRSCGQIFCADCSEFWAPVPDERLYTPVRLCGPCYHAVTTRIQQQSRAGLNSTHSYYQKPPIATTISSLTAQLDAFNSPAISSSSRLIAAVAATTTSVTASSYCVPSTSMEACKHAASPQQNDRNSFKATAASN